MSDVDLRTLARRFRASGSSEDEAAWLRARVQTGELKDGQLRLAAHLGHEAARTALGAAAPEPTLTLREWDHPVEFNALFDTVARAGESGCEPLLRVVVALARRLLPLFEACEPEDLGPRRAVQVGERWLCEPGGVDRGLLREAAWAAGASSDRVVFDHVRAHDVAELAQRVAEAAQSVATGDHERTLASVESGTFHALRAVDVSQVNELERAVADELVPWALGYADPVRERASSGRGLPSQADPRR